MDKVQQRGSPFQKKQKQKQKDIDTYEDEKDENEKDYSTEPHMLSEGDD